MKGAATAVNLIIKDKSDKPKPKKNLLSKPEYERRVVSCVFVYTVGRKMLGSWLPTNQPTNQPTNNALVYSSCSPSMNADCGHFFD